MRNSDDKRIGGYVGPQKIYTDDGWNLFTRLLSIRMVVPVYPVQPRGKSIWKINKIGQKNGKEELTMERLQCVSALDYIKDWNTWKNTLKAGIAEAKKLGVSDETIQSLAVKIGDFLSEKVCPESKEDQLLQEMWSIATPDERKTIATLIFKMVK